jgi:hypothetical protein
MRTYDLTETLRIDTEKFLNWYLTERDFIDIVYNDLLNFSRYTISLEYMLESIQNQPIPEKILMKGQEYTLDKYGDVDTYHVKLTLV